ncbi:MAG: response regulator [Opitutaceae bacterium]|nr:response regulator [Opitutaceae bacterium]
MKSLPQLPPVLIADDDPDGRFLTQRLLHKAGVTNPIVAVENGEAAIAYLRSTCPAAGGKRCQKPVAAFIDIKMPVVDGFGVLRWARRKKALRKMKIFMLSSSDLDADRGHAAELGADGYLVKYPTPETFSELLRPTLLLATAS